MRLAVVTFTLYGAVHSAEFQPIHSPEENVSLMEEATWFLEWNYPEATMSNDISIISVMEG